MKYIYTIQRSDISKRSLRVKVFDDRSKINKVYQIPSLVLKGIVFKGDVGKQVFFDKGKYYVESDEQAKNRITS